MNTKTRILDTAERLFAHHGIEATSLRMITAQAEVNLAAVNYHFQTKEALLHAVIARRIDPINEQRLKTLDALEAAAGDGALPLDKVLDTLIRPIVELMRGPGANFGPVMSRIFSESSELAAKVFERHLGHVSARFFHAVSRALPGIPKTELEWRMLFVMGAVSHTIGRANVLRALSGGRCDPSDAEGTLRRLEAFILAGLQAPLPVEVEHAMH